MMPESSGYKQKYFTQALAKVYRNPSKFSGAYKLGLYELADRNPEIHYAAIAINQARRRGRGG